ncbi:MAG: ABC transporter permease [Actinomycetota bacterium]|nr:ABC transporter permease [Actinomycetota bacterium]
MSGAIDLVAPPGEAPERQADAIARREAYRGEAVGPWQRAVRYAGMPLFVGAAFLLLYLWVQGQQIGEVEQRVLNANAIRRAITQHLQISLWSTLLVLLTAIPAGIALTRPWARGITPAILAIANIGQGVPAIGTFVVVYLVFLRNGQNASIVGLAIYCFLPVLRGTMVGLEQVDRDLIKAARGMGLSKSMILRRIELPMSVPILLTGVRTALVLNVSTAVLAGFIAGGGIGAILLQGFGLRRQATIVTGSVLAGGFALLADWVGRIVEDVLRPKGL